MTSNEHREILGIHHITAIASDPQLNLDFYTGVLGLRLVKKTVNFDDPGTYHFYFGDDLGRPGSILTFFPWLRARRGSRGVGQATVAAFSVPEEAIGFWLNRLQSSGVTVDDPSSRFDEEFLTFLDPDGLKLELVAHRGTVESEIPGSGPVPAENAIRGFHSVTLEEKELEVTADFLEKTMGFRLVAELDNRHRFEVVSEGVASLVDVLYAPSGTHGSIAAGTVHHVAWRVAGDEEEEWWRDRLLAAGHHVSPVMDRQYFHSIYFREPGGVLFEIATDPPGFGVDESIEALGTALKLPPWLEEDRETIEAALPRLVSPPVAELEGR